MPYLIAPLANVTMSSTLRIDENTYIEKTPEHVNMALLEARFRGIYRHPVKYDNCLVISNFQESDDSQSRVLLEKLITLFRIYMQGNIFYSGGIIDPNDWYTDPKKGTEFYIFGIFFYVVWDNKEETTIYTITEENHNSLVEFIRSYRSSELLSESPFRMFFKGYHEPFGTDRFLDNAIGLESLLVNDGGDNLKYKYIDRGSYLLRRALSEKPETESLVKKLSDIYDMRSSLVHNRNKINDQNQIDNASKDADNFLRILLKYILQNPNLINSKQIDREKRNLY